MKEIASSEWLVFQEQPNGNLWITPTTAGVEEAKGMLQARQSPSAATSQDCQLHQMFEYFYGNGWQQIRPEDIGALTDAPIISQDFTINDDGEIEAVAPKPVVYWHMNYMVEDPIETWANCQAVCFDVAEVQPKKENK